MTAKYIKMYLHISDNITVQGAIVPVSIAKPIVEIRVARAVIRPVVDVPAELVSARPSHPYNIF